VFLPPEHTALALRQISPTREPIGAFEALRGRACPWLLDSSLPSLRLGRFSFAGADPYLLLRARGGSIELECRRAVHAGLTPGRRVVDGDFFETARALLPRLPMQAGASEFPFVGGALCALGYELAEQIEELRLGGLDDLALPDATLLFVDRVLVWDHRHERLFALALGFGAQAAAARDAAEQGARALASWLASPRPAPEAAARGGSRGAPRAPFAFFDEGSYAKAVDIVKQEIARGNVYQACLTHRLERDFRGDPWRLYRALRRINPAPFACYLELPEVAIVGSSPERFLRVGRDRRVESRPIKGTRPRGRHAAEDAANRTALERSAKDRAENLMIVDLVRNDLGRVCETGSVAVPELMALEEYASVFQMVSTVTGRLREDRDALDLVRATFPPGSMTGAPKIAAMRLLGRLEPVCRGVYSGAIGYLDARGGADLSVVIRTLLLRAGRAYLHTGGAVVADSDPRDEWRETLDKARPLLAALDEVDEAS
jgi:aminodeoxychorismate synthase component I